MKMVVLCCLVLMTACASPPHASVRETVKRVNHDVISMDAGLAPTLMPVVEEPVKPAPMQQKELVPAKRRILIVGDSEACTVAHYVKKVKLSTDIVNVDCKGATTVQYWAAGGNFRAALNRHPKPDTVLVFLGTNNYWNKTAPNAKPILDQVTERGFGCVWVGNTAVKGKKWPINGLLRDAVTPTCSYFDTEAADISLPDGVHPGPSGAVKWLRLVWEMIPMKYEEPNED